MHEPCNAPAINYDNNIENEIYYFVYKLRYSRHSPIKMAAHNPVDVVEEDAADLCFPKGE